MTSGNMNTKALILETICILNVGEVILYFALLKSWRYQKGTKLNSWKHVNMVTSLSVSLSVLPNHTLYLFLPISPCQFFHYLHCEFFSLLADEMFCCISLCWKKKEGREREYGESQSLAWSFFTLIEQHGVLKVL